MDTSKVRQAKRRTTKYVYACECGELVNMGAIRHKKQVSGRANFHHRCHTKGTLTFTGRSIKS